MKSKDLTRFVRFGGLDLKNQKGFRSDQSSYHAPPAPRGFYAMPKVAQEFWLISSMSNCQPGTVPKRPKCPADASDQEHNELLDSYYKRYDKAISCMRKEFTKRDGCLWHHLSDWTKPAQVISRNGSWVKTSVKDWRAAFSKMSLSYRYGSGEFSSSSINSCKGITGFFSKDHCEVFIDEKP